MFDVAKEMGLQQTIPTRDQFRSACSENDSRSFSEHVLRNLPRVRLHDTNHVVLAIYTETEHPGMYEDAAALLVASGAPSRNMQIKLFPHVINFGARAPKTTRDRFRSTCSEIDHVRLHDTNHVVLAIYTETEHPMYVYEDA